MRVLIACEFSGVVRRAFTALGHYAVSCDMLGAEDSPCLRHYCGDVRDILDDGWDLAICHPPCTYLTISANKWMKPEYREKYPDRPAQREAAIEFFLMLYHAPIPRVCVENPIGVMSTRFRKPDQVIQPWMFGHGETKATCLWLKNLPRLRPTHQNGNLFTEPEPEAREQRLHRLPPGPNRWRERSRTFTGIAAAMADQWGQLGQG